MKSNIEQGKNTNIIVLDCSRISKADYTSAKCIAALADDLKKSGKTMVFLRVEPKLAQIFAGASSIPVRLAATEDDLKELLNGV